MLEEAVLGSDTANARAAKGMWSDLALLKRSSVLAAARSTSKLGTLERAAFQRHLADFQPGERKTSLGLATGHALLVVLQAKAVLALATVVTEWLICAVADTRADAQPRLRRTGTLAAVQQSAYYAMVGLATLAIPSMPWCARAPPHLPVLSAARAARRVCAHHSHSTALAARTPPCTPSGSSLSACSSPSQGRGRAHCGTGPSTLARTRAGCTARWRACASCCARCARSCTRRRSRFCSSHGTPRCCRATGGDEGGRSRVVRIG